MGTLLVTQAVDRSFDQVWVDTGPEELEASVDNLDALDMAINALTDAGARLASIYEGTDRPARGCVGIDEGGYRCGRPSRHDGEHDYSAERAEFEQETA
jgi:hypothetical protein